MKRNNLISYIIFLLTSILIILGSYYYISFPTIYDTFSYLISAGDVFNGVLTNNSLHYSIFNITTHISSLFQVNLILTYIGFIVFLIVSYKLTMEIYGRNGSILFLLIYGIYIYGSYRFFLGGYLQILLFIGINLSLLLQIKFNKKKDYRYLVINYIYLICIGHLNDFGILLLAFNLIYNTRRLVLNKTGMLLGVFILSLWISAYLLEANNLLNLEYPEDGKLKLIYNIIFNPFIWGPRLGLYYQFLDILGIGYKSYFALAIFVLGFVIIGVKKKLNYVTLFIIFYGLTLLLLPAAPSLNRYVSYYIPYVGLLSCLLILKILQRQKIIITLLALFSGLILVIHSESINNEFITWNKYGRYGLEYRIAKDYICPRYGNEIKIYGHFGSPFTLGFIDGGCKKENLIYIGEDFYYGKNPVDTIISNKPHLFIHSRIIDYRFKFDEYLQEYLQDTQIILEKVNDTPELIDLFGKYKGSKWRLGIFNISYKNKSYQIKSIPFNKDGKSATFKVPVESKKFYVHINHTQSKDSLYLNINGKTMLDIMNNIPYTEKDWSRIIIPVENVYNGENINLEYNGLGIIEEISYIQL